MRQRQTDITSAWTRRDTKRLSAAATERHDTHPLTVHSLTSTVGRSCPTLSSVGRRVESIVDRFHDVGRVIRTEFCRISNGRTQKSAVIWFQSPGLSCVVIVVSACISRTRSKNRQALVQAHSPLPRNSYLSCSFVINRRYYHGEAR